MFNPFDWALDVTCDFITNVPYLSMAYHELSTVSNLEAFPGILVIGNVTNNALKVEKH